MDGEFVIHKQNGLPHRIDGPAVIHCDGTKMWYQAGVKHREKGPAVVYPDGTKEWWIAGCLHREDGPAIEYADGRTHHCISQRGLAWTALKGQVPLLGFLKTQRPYWLLGSYQSVK